MRSKSQVKAGINHWLEFYEDRKVSDLRDVYLQEQFHKFLFNKNMRGESVSRVITVGRAALNRAYKRGELSHTPFIHDLPKVQKQDWSHAGGL